MANIDELLERWDELSENGVKLSPEQLCCDCPELLDEVRKKIDLLNAFECRFGVRSAAPLSRPISSQDFTPPTDLKVSSRFKLLNCHAMGGLGQVYVAEDRFLGRRVAIKFPKRQAMSQQQVDRFNLEARITGLLDHPNIVPIYSLEADEIAEPCYVMRFVEGNTLYDEIRQKLPAIDSEGFSMFLSSEIFRDFLRSFIAVCNATAFAHKHGIIHRDIKPSNILLGPFGETLLLDWGLAKYLGSEEPWNCSTSASGQCEQKPVKGLGTATIDSSKSIGTPAYASPEQLLGHADVVNHSTDVYSLGATLFFMLCGKSPMELLGWSQYLQRLSDNQELEGLLPASIPKELRAICSKAIRLQPDERYGSPLEIIRDVECYLAGEPVSVLKETRLSNALRYFRKKPAVGGALLAALVVASITSTGSLLIISKKNVQIAEKNDRLINALKKTETANDIAMNALRSTLDEVIADQISKQDEISDSTRGYLHAIINQYSQIASLQDDRTQMEVIRSEAFGQVGVMYYRLNQNEDAKVYLERSIRSYQAVQDKLSLKDVALMARFGEMLSAVFIELNQFNHAKIITSELIATLRKFTAKHEFIGDSDIQEGKAMIESTLLSLHELRAKSLANLGESELADEDFRFVVDALQSRIDAAPSNQHLLVSAGSALRAYAEHQRLQSKSVGDLQNARKSASLAIEYLQRACDLRPDTHGYQSALAWAYYDRSIIYEDLASLNEAIEDLRVSADLTEEISSSHPLFQTYRLRLIRVLLRRAKLLEQIGKLDDAYVEVRRAAEHCSAKSDFLECIARIQAILNLKDKPFVNRDAAESLLANLNSRTLPD